MISIRPKWCKLIASGKKTIEVRKSRPKIETPFKCYIYQCLPKSGDWNERDGRVIGEFVCDRIDDITVVSTPLMEYIQVNGKASMTVNSDACLDIDELSEYANGKTLCGWHISDLVIYDKPKELREFKKINRECWYADLGLAKRDCTECQNAGCMMTRPPQSWCYCEPIENI